jgi:GTP-binding protein
MKFIDIATIDVKSGHGGKGHMSFRREKFAPKGGPDGGNGGKGGDVIFFTDPQLNTLLDFRYKREYFAEDGKPGAKNKMYGRDGIHALIRVPVGTIVKDAETDEILADLDKSNVKMVLMRGGKGGKGNAEFATSTNQAPRYSQPGLPGDEKKLVLELKLIADVGLVGYPNVGKSTLISVISDAKPKIADYHFTTLVPNLGIVRVEDYKSYTVADIPGLIEGASEGKGLGHQFLRHVERTKVLVFLLDGNSDDIKKDYKVLNKELKKYNPEMQFKKRIICVSKCDAIEDDKIKKLTKIIDKKSVNKECEHLMISSITRQNTEKLKYMLWDIIKSESKVEQILAKATEIFYEEPTSNISDKKDDNN